MMEIIDQHDCVPVEIQLGDPIAHLSVRKLMQMDYGFPFGSEVAVTGDGWVLVGLADQPDEERVLAEFVRGNKHCTAFLDVDSKLTIYTQGDKKWLYH